MHSPPKLDWPSHHCRSTTGILLLCWLEHQVGFSRAQAACSLCSMSSHTQLMQSFCLEQVLHSHLMTSYSPLCMRKVRKRTGRGQAMTAWTAHMTATTSITSAWILTVQLSNASCEVSTQSVRVGVCVLTLDSCDVHEHETLAHGTAHKPQVTAGLSDKAYKPCHWHHCSQIRTCMAYCRVKTVSVLGLLAVDPACEVQAITLCA